MTHDKAIEAAAMLACEYALGGKACPCRESGQFKCRDEIPGGFARAVAPLLMEHGARLMQERAAVAPQIVRDRFGLDRIACMYCEAEIRSIDPATIVREAK
jgi:hypothetical protein